LLLGVAGARERETERQAANIDLDKHFASFSQHPQCLFSTFSFPCGDGYYDPLPLPLMHPAADSPGLLRYTDIRGFSP
jgi:hypothetical protein